MRLFQEGAVLEQYIPFGDGLWDTRGHQDGSSTQDNDLIGVKNCIAVFIKNDQLVAVFLFDLLAKLAYAGLASGLFKSILLVHPGLEGRGKGHDDHGQIDMGAEGGGSVARSTLNEPGLFGLAKDCVFYLASGILKTFSGFCTGALVRITRVSVLGLLTLYGSSTTTTALIGLGVKSERFS